MFKSPSRIVVVALSFCLILSHVEGLAQAAVLPGLIPADFSSVHFCREAVPAPLAWVHRTQGLGYALRRIAAATLTAALAGSAALASPPAGRSPAGVQDRSRNGRPPTMTFEKALTFARKQGGLDIRPEHRERVEGLFGNLQVWTESTSGRDAMKAWKSRPVDWNVWTFVNNLKIQSDKDSVKVEYRLDAELIDLLEDPRVQVLRLEKPGIVYVLIPATPTSSGGLFRVSGAFKGDDPDFIVAPWAIIEGGAPVALTPLKSLLLPILLLLSPTLQAASLNPLTDDSLHPLKEFWNMLMSGEILHDLQPHVDVASLGGWEPITRVLFVAAMLVLVRWFHPRFDRKTWLSEPWTFAQGVRLVLVVALFVLLSGTTLKAFGPNVSLGSPASTGSFMFLTAA